MFIRLKGDAEAMRVLDTSDMTVETVRCEDVRRAGIQVEGLGVVKHIYLENVSPVRPRDYSALLYYRTAQLNVFSIAGVNTEFSVISDGALLSLNVLSHEFALQYDLRNLLNLNVLGEPYLTGKYMFVLDRYVIARMYLGIKIPSESGRFIDMPEVDLNIGAVWDRYSGKLLDVFPLNNEDLLFKTFVPFNSDSRIRRAVSELLTVV